MAAYVTGADQVTANLMAYYAGLRAAMAAAAVEVCDLLTMYAQENHPWRDDTGDTRASTLAEISQADAERIVITLHAGMDYDVLLELAQDGKWAWLMNAVLANLDAIQEILRKHGVAATASGIQRVSDLFSLTPQMGEQLAGNAFGG